MEDTNKKIDDLTKVVLDFAQYVQEQFEDVRGDMQRQFELTDRRLARVEATMVTKEYLDDKMADMKGELMVLTRREDEALGELVNAVHRRKGIDDKDAQRIHSLRPFPKASKI